MSSDDHNYLSNSNVSRRAFLLGGAGFLGGAALLSGCRNVGDNANAGNVASGSKTPPGAPAQLHTVIKKGETQ